MTSRPNPPGYEEWLAALEADEQQRLRGLPGVETDSAAFIARAQAREAGNEGLLERYIQETNAQRRNEGVAVQPETSETEPIVSGRSPVPPALNSEQLDYFTNLIQDNPPELSSIISNVKETFPDQLGDIIPTTEDELNNLSLIHI